MTYRFTGKTKDGHEVLPRPGLPLEASDKDFNSRREAYDELNGEGAFEAVKKSGMYEHVNEAASSPAKED